MDKFPIFRNVYKNVVRPLLFTIDSEVVHDLMTQFGETLENQERLLESLFAFKNEKLSRKVIGINFPNPVGLGAGFDYDGHLAKTMGHVGFGFNTVGTVTAKPYEGNKKPRLSRLVASRSLIVNKGFKSEGAVAVAERLDRKNLVGHTVGISVGSSNVPSVNTISKAIDDYIECFEVFKNKGYISYFELNISCPNTALTESFILPKHFKELVKAISRFNNKKPIFVKMPNEIDFSDSDKLVTVGLANGIEGYIFSNLAKDRNNKFIHQTDLKKARELRGGFGGKITAQKANLQIQHTRKVFGENVSLIGLGGIFTPEDARERFKSGADLIQLVTGMVYEGPQIAGEINSQLLNR